MSATRHILILLATLLAVSILSVGVVVADGEPSGERNISATVDSIESTDSIETDEDVAALIEASEPGVNAELAPRYDLEFESGGLYSVGVPGPTDQTVEELFDLEFEGVVYGYDAEREEWIQVNGSDEVDELDGFVLRADEDTTAEVMFAEGDSSEPAQTDLEEGWNFVSAPEQASSAEAFSEDVTVVDNPGAFDEPSVSPATEDEFDRTAVEDGPTVNPFKAYFVEAQAGTLDGNTAEGLSLSEANTALGLEPRLGIEITETDAQSLPGETHTVSAAVTNLDDETVSKPVEFVVDDDRVESKEVTLDPGDSTEKTYDIETDEQPVGAYGAFVRSAVGNDGTSSVINAERSVDEETAYSGESVSVTVAGEIEQRETIILTEQFDPSVESSELENLTVDGESQLENVIVNVGDNNSITVVVEDVPAGKLEASYELEFPEDNSSEFQLGLMDESFLALETEGQAGEQVGLEGANEVTVKPNEPTFELSNISPVDETIAHGDDLNVSADLRNEGGAAGEANVSVEVLDEDNETVYTETTNESLESEAETTVSFEEISTSGFDAGSYTHRIETADESVSGNLTVSGQGAIAGGISLDTVDPEETVDVDIGIEETNAETTVTLEEGDSNANYTFSDIDPGESYTVSADADNYIESTESVTVEADETATADLDLERETGEVSGTVTDSDSGDALSDTNVSIYRFADNTDGDTFATTTTDENGAYQLEDVPVGDHIVEAVVDEGVENNTSVSVDADETSEADVGIGTPSDTAFDVDIIGSENISAAGGQQSFTTEIENTGERDGSQTIELEYGDEVETQTETVAVDGGDTVEETFTVDIGDDQPVGDYTVSIESEDDRDTAQAQVGFDRNIDQDTAGAGETVTVTVSGTLGEPTGVTLVDTFDPTVADSSNEIPEIDGNAVFPTVQDASDSGVVISVDSDEFENETPGELLFVYEIEIPEDADSNAAFGYDADSSLVEVDGNATEIVGDDSVSIDG